jgi:hypothetical protein
MLPNAREIHESKVDGRRLALPDLRQNLFGCHGRLSFRYPSTIFPTIAKPPIRIPRADRREFGDLERDRDPTPRSANAETRDPRDDRAKLYPIKSESTSRSSRDRNPERPKNPRRSPNRSNPT